MYRTMLSSVEKGRLGNLSIKVEELNQLANWAGERYCGKDIKVIEGLNEIIQDNLDREKIKTDRDDKIEMKSFLGLLFNEEVTEKLCQLKIEPGTEQTGEDKTLREEIKGIIGSGEIMDVITEFCIAFKNIAEAGAYQITKINPENYESLFKRLDNRELIPEEIRVNLNNQETNLRGIAVIDKDSKIRTFHVIHEETGKELEHLSREMDLFEPSYKDLSVEFRIAKFLKEDMGYGNYIEKQKESVNEIKLGNIEVIEVKIFSPANEDCLQKGNVQGQLLLKSDLKGEEREKMLETLANAIDNINGNTEYFVYIVRKPYIPRLSELIKWEKADIEKKDNSIILRRTGERGNPGMVYDGCLGEVVQREEDGKIISERNIEYMVKVTLKNDIKSSIEKDNPQKSVKLEQIRGEMAFIRNDYAKTGKKPVIIIDMKNAEEPVSYAKNAKDIMEILNNDRSEIREKTILKNYTKKSKYDSLIKEGRKKVGNRYERGEIEC